MEPLKTKKWSRIQNYIQLSFKRSKNEVKRTFLAPSKIYHVSTSTKINQVLEVRLKLKTNIFAYSIGQLFLNCPAGQLRVSFIWRSSIFYYRLFRFPQITQPKAVCCILSSNTHFELLLFRIFWTTSNVLLGIRSMKHAPDLLSNYRVRQNISH